MAARYEPQEADSDQLHHLSLERAEHATRHSKEVIDVDTELVVAVGDDTRPAELPEQNGRDEHRNDRDDRDDANHRDLDQQPEKPESIKFHEAGQAPVDQEHQPDQVDAPSTENVTNPQDAPSDHVHQEAVAEDHPQHHAVLADHSGLEGHVDAVSLAPGPASVGQSTHLTVLIPPQPQPPQPPPPAQPSEPQQPVKKKRKTYSNEEERRKARILKNRRTAEESRQRRMKKMKELEEYVAGAALREKELQEDLRLSKVQVQALTESIEQMANEKNAVIAQKDAEIQRLREKLHLK